MEEIIDCEGGEILELVAQRSDGWDPWRDAGQLGWGFEQPDLVKSVPDHGRRVGTRGSFKLLSNQTIL